MRILFANHTASMSGAELALLRLLDSLAPEHEIAVACPSRGPLATALDAKGISRTTIPAFEASFKPHPLHTPVGMARLCAGAAGLALAARRFKADVLYANTTRAGSMGALSRRLYDAPLVVRLHDHLPATAAGRAVRSLIAGSANTVLAVSDYTAGRFNDGRSRPIAVRVYNSVDHSRFDPARVAAARVREELGIDPDAVLLGQVAQITEWKRQDHSIRTLAELRRGGLDAHLLLIGEILFAGKRVRYDNRAYSASLRRLVAELGLGEAVHFLGQRNDVPALLQALDLSLLPSWEEPFGLAALESLAMGTPAVVSRSGGVAELVQDGVTGRVLPSASSQEWAEAIVDLLNDRQRLERMGIRGREAAALFGDETHAEEIVAHLQRAVSEPRASAARAGSRRHGQTGAQWPS
jgi:glycosyltransferase involved in cell wall biosynthesis